MQLNRPKATTTGQPVQTPASTLIIMRRVSDRQLLVSERYIVHARGVRSIHNECLRCRIDNSLCQIDNSLCQINKMDTQCIGVVSDPYAMHASGVKPIPSAGVKAFSDRYKVHVTEVRSIPSTIVVCLMNAQCPASGVRSTFGGVPSIHSTCERCQIDTQCMQGLSDG